MSSILKITNLSYCYDKEIKALNDISLEVEEGSYTTIIGHNGSGKSTLAKIIMGLLSGFEGTVEVFNTQLSRKTITEIRKRVGIVFQNPDNQFVGSTVADDIAFGLENKLVPHEEMEGIIQHYAKECGMSEFLNHEPSNLSGGQKQRVAIAGVLAMQPELIILDEATSMLDPKGKAEIRNLITKMKQDNSSLTIISITHDIEEAAISDKVIVLNEGSLVIEGKPNEVFSNQEKLKDIRLDVPFFYALKNSLQNRGYNLKGINSLKELEDYLCR